MLIVVATFEVRWSMIVSEVFVVNIIKSRSGRRPNINIKKNKNT